MLLDCTKSSLDPPLRKTMWIRSADGIQQCQNLLVNVIAHLPVNIQYRFRCPGGIGRVGETDMFAPSLSRPDRADLGGMVAHRQHQIKRLSQIGIDVLRRPLVLDADFRQDGQRVRVHCVSRL